MITADTKRSIAKQWAKRFLIDFSTIWTIGFSVLFTTENMTLTIGIMVLTGLYSGWSFADGLETGAKSATRVFLSFLQNKDAK